MKNSREFKKQGAKKISESLLCFTAGINHLDEQSAHQETLGQDTPILGRVRDRLRGAFKIEIEALKLEYGIA